MVSSLRLLILFVRECDNASKLGSSVDHTFLSTANRQMTLLESSYGSEVMVPATIDFLIANESVGSAGRVFLGYLLRTLPLDNLFILNKRKEKNCYPSGLFVAISKLSRSSDFETALLAIRSCSKIGTPECQDICFNAVNANDNRLRLTALRKLSSCPDLPNHISTKMVDNFLDSPDMATTLACSEIMFHSSFSTSKAEELLNSKSEILQEPHLLDNLLDAELPELAKLGEYLIGFHKLEKLPEQTKRKIMRNESINSKIRESCRSLAHTSTFRTLSGESNLYGTAVHRNSSATAFFVGHAGIYFDGKVVHCTVGHDPHAVRQDSFKAWKDGNEFWGYRRDKHSGVNYQNIVTQALERCSWRTEYDGAHNNQKGKWFKEWFSGKRYWESDCVGFVQGLYEDNGGNPTPGEYETGAGWPLTVREQRDFMIRVQ
jgi:hypothetical protein